MRACVHTREVRKTFGIQIIKSLNFVINMKFTDNLHFDEETIEFLEEFLEGFHAKNLRVE